MQRQYLTAFILLFLLNACSSYQYLDIDVIIPAKHSLKPEIKSVVLVDNSIPYRDSAIHKVILPREQFIIDTIWQDEFSMMVLEGLQHELKYRQFFDSVYVHPVSIKKETRLKNRALSWSQVDSLCSKYNAEAVIAFENHFYGTNIKVSEMADGYLLGYMDMNGAILWRAYNILDKELAYKEIQVDTISWDADGSRMELIAAQIPDIKKGLAELANYLGSTAANHMAPHWEGQKRGFYSTGNYQFMQAMEFVRNEHWGNAIKLWKYVYDHSEKKIKMKSAYNLALASEIFGDYETAKFWLDEAITILSENPSAGSRLDKSRVIQYASYISNRLKVVDDLHIQVGGFE